MAAFEYEWKVRTHKVAAQVAGEVFERLANSEAGLTPATLLDASRDESAPLHCEFEWRDDVAAEKYRLGQSQCLIQDLRTTIVRKEGKAEQIRAFVCTGERKSEYVPLDVALGRDDWKSNLLNQARKDAEYFVAKYRQLEELSGVVAAMSDFLHSA